jgi:predicted CXXCH cytochrome family protein
MHPTSAASWDFVAGKPLSCTSTCHDPHGTPNYRMLRVEYNSNGKGSDYLCLLCHTEVGISY